jgi:hypothetical protein
MSPWDEIPYFQVPKYTYVSLPTNTFTQVLKAEQRRIGIIFSNPNSSPTLAAGILTVTTDASMPQNAVPAQCGFNVISTDTPRSFLQKDYGVLIQSDWFALNTSAATVTLTVCEILLYKWNDVVANEGKPSQFRYSADVERIAQRLIAQPEQAQDYLLSAARGNGYSLE